jgi:hypothetical protein
LCYFATLLALASPSIRYIVILCSRLKLKKYILTYRIDPPPLLSVAKNGLDCRSKRGVLSSIYRPWDPGPKRALNHVICPTDTPSQVWL